ncbi:hypothetical protein [Saccharothrix carnea]|nr:hypothetical protein [Saccharothrix carnea]
MRGPRRHFVHSRSWPGSDWTPRCCSSPGSGSCRGRTRACCTFWLADALHGTGRVDEARELLERLLDLRNDVGLLSEEHDTTTGRHMGDIPQAFSMEGLFNTAHQPSGTSTRTSAGKEEQAL